MSEKQQVSYHDGDRSPFGLYRGWRFGDVPADGLLRLRDELLAGKVTNEVDQRRAGMVRRRLVLEYIESNLARLRAEAAMVPA